MRQDDPYRKPVEPSRLSEAVRTRCRDASAGTDTRDQPPPRERRLGRGVVMRPPVLIPHPPGVNRDREAALAVAAAGGDPRIAPMNDLTSGRTAIADHGAVLLPGGFSYGDSLGAGGRLALEMRAWFRAELREAVGAGRPILGICNGFQALVKSGLLGSPLVGRPSSGSPQAESLAAGSSRADGLRADGPSSARCGGSADISRPFTLTANENGRFECRWVTLRAEPGCSSSWLAPLGGSLMRCPVAHGEGRFAVRDPSATAALAASGQVAFRYMASGSQGPTARGRGVVPAIVAAGEYPANPNGSDDDIAGLCDASGAVVGLMPHPENHIEHWQRPSGPPGLRGLALFKALIEAAR